MAEMLKTMLLNQVNTEKIRPIIKLKKYFDRLAKGLAGLIVFGGCALTQSPPATVQKLVWPMPPEKPRILYVETLEQSDHFGKNKLSLLKEIVLGSEANKSQRLAKPYAVTTDRKGRVYVTDTVWGAVWIFDRENRQVRTIGNSGQERLVTPSGIVVDDARGIIFVSDTKLDRVFGYNESGKIVLAIGAKDEFYSPAGLALDAASNRLFVSDAGRHVIRVYDSVSGVFLFAFGKRGKNHGEFNFPTHVFLRNDKLYVTDTMNFRIQVFDREGKYLWSFGEIGAEMGQFARPKGVAVDSDGHVYIVDAAFNNFQVFNDKGELLLFVGGLGRDPGQFWLPSGIHIDAQDNIYVVDQYNHRIQVFRYLKDSRLKD